MAIISVVIPAYNAEKTIQETVASVLNQSFRDLEVIVIDDGSTDKTVAIVSSFKDERVCLFSYSNSGAQISRNRGIEKSTGDYISFLDADDLWAREKLEAQFTALQSQPDCAVAYSWTDCIDEQGNKLPGGQRFSFVKDVYEEILLRNFLGSGSNPLIRKDALLTVGFFDEAILAGQDWEMWIRLASRYYFALVPQVHIFYRRSTGSWSSNLQRQEQGCKQVIEKSLATAPEKIQKRRKEIMGNCYKYLIFHALGYDISRKQSLLVARFLFTLLTYEPGFMKNKAFIIIVTKIILGLILTEKTANTVWGQIKRLKSR